MTLFTVNVLWLLSTVGILCFPLCKLLWKNIGFNHTQSDFIQTYVCVCKLSPSLPLQDHFLRPSARASSPIWKLIFTSSFLNMTLHSQAHSWKDPWRSPSPNLFLSREKNHVALVQISDQVIPSSWASVAPYTKWEASSIRGLPVVVQT